MRLSEQLKSFGRNLVIAGVISIVCGAVMVVIESNGIIRWAGVLQMAALAAALLAAVVAYQRLIAWRGMQRRLLEARIVAVAPVLPVRRAPRWLWLFWALFALGLAYSISGLFAILFGCLLLGYGLSSPLLGRNVERLEAGRVVFYATRDPENRRPLVVRTVVGADDEPGGVD
jgi:hypothetical protein